MCRQTSFHGKDGKRYTWRAGRGQLEVSPAFSPTLVAPFRARSLSPGVTVPQLVREDMPEDKPVAVYHKEKRYAFMLKMSRHPYLEVDPVAMDTLDSLIGMLSPVWNCTGADGRIIALPVSFLLIERRRRQGAV